MPTALSMTLPLVLAAVMIASGVAKLRQPDDLAGWSELGVPRMLRQRWLVALHPWAELALGLAFALLGGVLGLLAALVGLALMASYLWLASAAYRRPQEASCACFGARRPITRLTIVRNAWLTLVAAGTAAVIWTNPLLGGAVAAADATAWAWIGGIAIGVVTAVLIAWPEPTPAETPVASAGSTVGASEDAEYVRVRTPAVPVMLADGQTVNLRKLTWGRPLLLLAVSETCGVCTPVIESAPDWRELLPEIDIRLLVTRSPEESKLADTAEPQTLHDPHNYVSGSIADWYSPTALLLGADGMLAGGPESGHEAIRDFVADIRAALDEQIAAG
ncbi:MAG TPA: hypothetical protein DCR63_06000 [Microbacterium sp.]|nr:hypothetical protein [Microbacterium sp.]